MQPMQAFLAYTSQPWTAGAWMRSAGFWGWTPAVESLVCSVPPQLCWENSPDLFSGLRRLWDNAAGCSWCLFLLLSPKASHFFPTSFYFPSASYRTPERVYSLGVQFIASEKVHANGRKKQKQSVSRGNATVRGGWAQEQAACGVLPGARVQLSRPVPPQHSAGLL